MRRTEELGFALVAAAAILVSGGCGDSSRSGTVDGGGDETRDSGAGVRRDGGHTTPRDGGGCVAATENTVALCSDGCDNDGDGRVDCADFGCASLPDCTADCTTGFENTEAACSDGCSNDGDALVDCADGDCTFTAACGECPSGPENTEAACSDGCSNDGDADVDCDDSDCEATTACGGSCGPSAESAEGTCSDGCDNDGDGQTDCDDPDCAGIGSCAPSTECTAGETRCIAGDGGRFQTCSSAGRWTTTACPAAHLCTDGECRRVCHLTTIPSSSYVCYVPNADGVNDGIFAWTNDPARMENGTYTGIQVHYSSSMRSAPIQRVPPDVTNAGDWPYEWILRSAGTLRQAEIQFRLDQFSALPGSLRTVTLRYWLRREPVIRLPDGSTINYLTRSLEYGWAPGGAGFFFLDGPYGIYDTYYDEVSIRTETIPGVVGVTRFNHSGGVNEMGVEVIGNDTGSPPMDTYVNFIMLTVE